MKRSLLVTLALTAVWIPALAMPWHTDLSGPGGGYWRERIPITAVNSSDQPAAGRIVELQIGGGADALPLAGTLVRSLRVCDQSGGEYLWEREGIGPRLTNGDRLRFAVDVPAHGEQTFYVYADNPAAIDPDEYLHAALVNGGFETDASTPDGWEPSIVDAKHVARYVRGEGRNGSRCVTIHVTPGAEATWAQWRSSDIRAIAGSRYRFHAWVRAKDVVGDAGWYIHVNGDHDMVVNQVMGAGNGTYDWREVSYEFAAPADSRTITIGTVLHGAGDAWYDDATLTEIGSAAPAPDLRIGTVERRTLRVVAGRATWDRDSANWPVRVSVSVRFFEGRAGEKLLATTEVRRAMHLARRLAAGPCAYVAARVVDPVTGKAVPSSTVGDRVCFSASVQPCTERRFYLYLRAEHRTPTISAQRAAYSELVAHVTNLVRAGDFENAAEAEAAWQPGTKGVTGAPHATVDVVTGGAIGPHASRLSVPANAPLDWSGRRQIVRGIEAGTNYLFAGFVKTQGVTDGDAQLHAHLLNATGALVRSNAFTSTGSGLIGDSDWKLLSAVIPAPEDCTQIELHLTMRAHGTAYHDGILLARTVVADTRGIETAAHRHTTAPLSVWSVNPMVKTFPDDPAQPARPVTIAAARNEYEPFVLAIRSTQNLKGLTVTATPLRGPRGSIIPTPTTYRVAYVPCDRPSGYYSSRVPEWRRRAPGGSQLTDGWAGEWPDPLAPLRRFDVPASRTQSLWFTVRVPRSAAPGEYTGTVTISAAGPAPVKIPVRLHVWRFVLPDENHLHIVYDLRSGPGWDVTAGRAETLRKWYRLYADHRMNPDMIQPAPQFRYADGKVTMDTTAYDEMARLCFDQLHMTHTYTPDLFYALGWAYPPRDIFGQKARTPEYEAALKDAYKLYIDHMTGNGWRKNVVEYVSDEPFFDRQQVVADLQYVSGLLRSVAPDVPVYSSTWRHCTGLNGTITQWGVGQYGCFPVKTMAERRAAGDRLWFTTDGQQAIDTPYLATERLLPTYCLKYDVTGYEFWGATWWTYNPWKRGWHQYIRQSDQGSEFYDIRYPNGDGYVTYPGEPVGVNGPLPSIRMEAIREGAEDYEYYILLRNLEQGTNAAGRTTAEQALDGARALVTIPNAGGPHSTEIMPDPDAIYRARRGVAAAIERLMPSGRHTTKSARGHATTSSRSSSSHRVTSR